MRGYHHPPYRYCPEKNYPTPWKVFFTFFFKLKFKLKGELPLHPFSSSVLRGSRGLAAMSRGWFNNVEIVYLFYTIMKINKYFLVKLYLFQNYTLLRQEDVRTDVQILNVEMLRYDMCTYELHLKQYSCMTLKPINIRWIRTTSWPF